MERCWSNLYKLSALGQVIGMEVSSGVEGGFGGVSADPGRGFALGAASGPGADTVAGAALGAGLGTWAWR
jgi:hypothetical protein